MALQMLYQSELGESSTAEVLHSFGSPGEFEVRTGAGDPDDGPVAPKALEPTTDRAFAYAQTLFLGVSGHQEEIDKLIREQAENWRLERMPPVDRNILRLAVYELTYQTDVPQLVILDEAIELAKRFGSENSGRFVNGLLDGLLKSHSFPGTLT
jgi:N utilization substance protein B